MYLRQLRRLLFLLLSVLATYLVCRIAFLMLNQSLFPGIKIYDLFIIFFYGFRFDISAIAYTNILLIVLLAAPLPSKNKKWFRYLEGTIFMVINGAALMFNCIDLEYFKFTSKRSTADLMQLMGMGDDLGILLPQFIRDYWYVVLIWSSLMMLLWYLYKMAPKITGCSANTRWYLKQSGILALVLILTIIAARGGLQLRPINILTAGQYVKSQNIPLVINTPFSIIQTFGKNELSQKEYFTEDELLHIYSPIHYNNDSLLFNKKNVVILIMESFSSEFIGSLNNYKGYTPNLDSIMEHSLVFTNAYANGKKSIEGLPAIIAGLPSLMNNPYITSAYNNNKITSIASILKEKGYHTSFFHGGTNGTMGFDSFTRSAGFDEYFGRFEYDNEEHYDGHWGIYDEEFFNFFNRKLDDAAQPFLGCFMSISSHHPYTVPEKYSDKFKGGPLDIHKSIEYADYALGQFFKHASKSPWYDNTLFVITADHTGASLLPYYKTMVGKYAIPLVLFDPGSVLIGKNEKVTQQIDIVPTILGYLNYQSPYFSFGNNALSQNNGYAVSYLHNVYQIIQEDYVLQFDGESSISLYNHSTDSLLKNNILILHPERVEKMENQLKSFTQVYNNCLINNRMTIKDWLKIE